MTIATHAAFFDASGKPKPGDVLFVSGFVSTETMWLQFEQEWKGLMAKWGIKKPFHTIHYARGANDDYARFRNNDAERVVFEKRVVEIIKNNTLKPFSWGLSIDDYNEANEQYAFSPGFDRPYSLAAFGALGSVAKWARKPRGRHDRRRRCTSMLVVFEDGDDDRGVFSDAMMRETGQRPILQKKENFPQFAACDILAWRHARLLKRGSLVEKGHSCFVGLFRQLPHDGTCAFLRAKEVLRMCEALEFERRD
jgi:hypothetical protein